MAPCKSACSRRMSRQSRVFSVWTVASLGLLLGPGQAAPVPERGWDPKFRAEQVGGHVMVAFYHPYQNATAYEVMLTHLYSICDSKIIPDSQVGTPITFDVAVKKCGTPMRVGVIALAEDKRHLTDTIETRVPNPAPAIPTNAGGTPGPEVEGDGGSTPAFPFTLLACVLGAVVLIAAAVGVLYLKKCRRGLSDTHQNNTQGTPLEMHPIYLPGDDTVTVFVELFMELLCAHANVLVRPYRDSEEEIRRDPGAWVERRMMLPCIILFRSPGLSRSAEGSDHYGVVKPALARLATSQHTHCIVVDVFSENVNQRNNVSRAERDGSASHFVLDLITDRNPEDFEKLVRRLHEDRDYPQEQMARWQDCRIFRHLQEQIRSLQNEAALSMERVSCECRETSPEAGTSTDPLLHPARYLSEV